MNNILVIAAHPDDEILGAGGTLIKHVKNDDNVFVLILGEGAMSRKGTQKKIVKKLQQQTLKAGKIIGFEKIFFSDFPDNSFDKEPLLKIIQEIEKYLEKIKPAVVYTHYGDDLNIDHELTYRAVLTASRPANPYGPKMLCVFETLSSTECQETTKNFQPNYYINIEKEISRKILAMKEYKLELRDYPHPRSELGLKVLAQYRGMESGLKFAEAFKIIRKIS